MNELRDDKAAGESGLWEKGSGVQESSVRQELNRFERQQGRRQGGFRSAHGLLRPKAKEDQPGERPGDKL